MESYYMQFDELMELYQDAKKIVPLYDVEFSVHLDVIPRKVYTTLGSDVTWEITEGALHLIVRKLEIFDVVHVEY